MSRTAPTAALPAGYRALPLRAATLPPATHINCYVVGTQDALVVDPGSAYPAELERLRSVLFSLRGRGGTLAAVVLTHHHRDHCAGARYVAAEFDLPILAHRETFARLPSGADRPVVPHGEISDGERIVFDAGRALQVLHTPGHAPGHCCLLEQAGGVLLSGDMILTSGTTLIDPQDGDMSQYIGSLSKIVDTAPGWVLPGHGPASADGLALGRQLLQHRRWREQRIHHCVSSGAHGQTTPEITRCAYGQPTSLVTLAAAQRSALAHLQKLAAEGSVRLVDGAWWPQGSGC